MIFANLKSACNLKNPPLVLKKSSKCGASRKSGHLPLFTSLWALKESGTVAGKMLSHLKPASTWRFRKPAVLFSRFGASRRPQREQPPNSSDGPDQWPITIHYMRNPGGDGGPGHHYSSSHHSSYSCKLTYQMKPADLGSQHQSGGTYSPCWSKRAVNRRLRWRARQSSTT